MSHLSSFWTSNITDWLLVVVTAVGVFGTIIAGAGALLVGIMTYRVNHQTQNLQKQIHEQQLYDRREQRLREFSWAYTDWENRQRSNDEMRYLAENSLQRLQNLQATVRFHEWKHPETDSTFSFMQIGEGVAEGVEFIDVSLPQVKEWTRVDGDDRPTMAHQDVVIAVLNDRYLPHNGTLVKFTWYEPELEPSEAMGESHQGMRQLKQFIYIPPVKAEPAPVFVQQAN